MNRYVIVGSGVTGTSAAAVLRASDRTAEITLVSDDPHGYYSRPGLAYYLTGEIPEKQLYIYNDLKWRELNIHFVKQRVTRLRPDAHQLQLHPLGVLSYDRLLLATGSTSLSLKVPGADLQGVVKLDDFEDALRLRKLARRIKTAVVVGGGIVAMEMIEGLVSQGVKVQYLLRGERYWPAVLDEAESRLVEQRLSEEGVQFHYRTEVAEIYGSGGKVTGVKTTGGEVLKCGMVAVGIGVQARIELAQTAGLKTERGILTNEYLQTTDPDVFAAGDVAQFLDPLTGRSTIDNLWNPGREQGEAAGRNMAGQMEVYHKPVIVNIARLAGLLTTIIGAVGGGKDDELISVERGSSENWQALPGSIAMESGSEVNHMRLMVGERTLQGAVLIGDQSVSFPLQELILAQVDITPIRAHLIQPTASLGQEIMEYWTKWRQHAAQ